ncbi:MAG: NADH:ubiquinone oxidoreductase [Acidobacteria bacterium]|nr:NADH:ubiquinone oxidoreductase [Acidobacteriota bacterium]
MAANAILQRTIKEVCRTYGRDRTRMMDIVRELQERLGFIPGDAMDLIAEEVGTARVEVESVVSFYAFLSEKPKGPIVIRLCNDIVDKIHGVDRVADALKDELGIEFGETTADGKITLEWTACIGMSDQAPAALVNDVVVTHLSSDEAREMVRELRRHGDPRRLVRTYGDGNNAHELIRSMVSNNVRRTGPVIFAELDRGSALRKAIAMSPAEVIRNIKTARLRGRGGAGFPAGMKWEFTRASEGAKKFVVCNADEGEPGTFKDRVILTERADLLFEGMTIAGYAIGATQGIVYLRAEYEYLRRFLESVLAERRRAGLLGHSILGKPGFDYDIRIQMGAGAYVCGEETSLLSSCEGLRGDPKNRPPFPAQKGYLGYPTSINNVETFCCVARILEEGAAWFLELGSKGSSGTKLFSISGDCRSPGVYELPFGITLGELLKIAGADDAIAVQVGGPSGQMVGPTQFDRTLCYDDLATGGSIMVFGPDRDPLEIAHAFMDFFIEESCGYCTPCRVGNVLLLERLEKVQAGLAGSEDLVYLQELGETVKAASRCGLGQTSPNPVLTTLKNFRELYERNLTAPDVRGLLPTFDIDSALATAKTITGRDSMHFPGK